MLGHNLDVKRHFRAYEKKGLEGVQEDNRGRMHQLVK